MKPARLLPALLAAALAACSAAPAPQPTAASTAAAAPAASATPAPATAAAPVEAPLAPPGTIKHALADGEYLLPFTIVPELAETHDPRVLQWSEHPCGATPYARVRALPLDDKLLLADEVIEIDDAGQELRRWRKPFEADVVAIDGERLRLRSLDGNGVEQLLWTDPAGALAPARVAAEAEPRRFDCPTLKAFAGSDFVQCLEYADAGGAKRKLAYEGVCT
ncbi:hypothetical protein [Lysobacter sp. CA196]|uniref:hypothetical protein n=1 Tax=Lysobacter sp. CA196 TaxID=3455606 RepID=UPI003F8D7AB3